MIDHARPTAVAIVVAVTLYECLGDWIWRAILAWVG